MGLINTIWSTGFVLIKRIFTSQWKSSTQVSQKVERDEVFLHRGPPCTWVFSPQITSLYPHKEGWLSTEIINGGEKLQGVYEFLNLVQR